MADGNAKEKSNVETLSDRSSEAPGSENKEKKGGDTNSGARLRKNRNSDSTIPSFSSHKSANHLTSNKHWGELSNSNPENMTRRSSTDKLKEKKKNQKKEQGFISNGSNKLREYEEEPSNPTVQNQEKKSKPSPKRKIQLVTSKRELKHFVTKDNTLDGDPPLLRHSSSHNSTTLFTGDNSNTKEQHQEQSPDRHKGYITTPRVKLDHKQGSIANTLSLATSFSKSKHRKSPKKHHVSSSPVELNTNSESTDNDTHATHGKENNSNKHSTSNDKPDTNNTIDTNTTQPTNDTSNSTNDSITTTNNDGDDEDDIPIKKRRNIKIDGKKMIQSKKSKKSSKDDSDDSLSSSIEEDEPSTKKHYSNPDVGVSESQPGPTSPLTSLPLKSSLKNNSKSMVHYQLSTEEITDIDVCDAILSIRSSILQEKQEHMYHPPDALQISDFLVKKVYTLSRRGLEKRMKVTNFAPNVFSSIRQFFQVDDLDYLNVWSHKSLLSLKNDKNKTKFIFSTTSKYVIVCIKGTESKLLRDFMPSYYAYVVSNPNTLLGRMLGHFRLKKRVSRKTIKTYLIVYQNLFPKRVDKLYVIKPSGTVGKSNSIYNPNWPAWKDQSVQFYYTHQITQQQHSPLPNITNEIKELFIVQLKSDSEFLAKNQLCDYTFILGTLANTDGQNSDSAPSSPFNKRKVQNEKRLVKSQKSTSLDVSNKQIRKVKSQRSSSHSDTQHGSDLHPIQRDLQSSPSISSFLPNSVEGNSSVPRLLFFVESSKKPKTPQKSFTKMESKHSKLLNKVTLAITPPSERSNKTFFQQYDGGILCSGSSEQENDQIFFFGIVDFLNSRSKNKTNNYLKTFISEVLQIFSKSVEEKKM